MKVAAVGQFPPISFRFFTGAKKPGLCQLPGRNPKPVAPVVLTFLDSDLIINSFYPMLTEVKADSEAVTTGIVYPAPSSAGEENLQNSAV